MDLEKDEQIISAMTSNEFSNLLIYYQFEGNEYPIRIICNPKKEMLWGPDLLIPVSISLAIIADAPIPLARHLEDIVLELRGSYDDSYFSLKHKAPRKGFSSIWPVHIAESLNDRANDEIIQSTFNSTIFVNQIIYYHFKDKYYQVRLLHNPEGRTFSAKKKLEIDGSLNEYSLSWNKKYAILVDNEAPEELINYLSASLKHLSYWNWYFNFTLKNGTYVEYVERRGDWEYFYPIDSWFNYTQSF